MTGFSAGISAIRFGYGLGPQTAPYFRPDDLISELDRAAAVPPLFPLEGVQGRRDALIDFASREKAARAERRAVGTGGAEDDAIKVLRREVQKRFRRDSVLRVTQAVLSPYAFHERLASFWINHFTVSASKSPVMRLLVPLYEAQAIRPHLAGSFRDLLISASLHPAMVIFLDQAKSVGPGSRRGKRQGGEAANENFAREVMELHTLGAGSGYSQADVQALALMLTGVTLAPTTTETVFNPRVAEPGSFAILGQRYGREGSLDDARTILSVLADDPRTARHVSSRLAKHFIGDQPRHDLVEKMALRWRETHGDLSSVYAVMLEHPAAWTASAGKTKMPLDYVVSSLKAFGFNRAQLLNTDDADDPDGESDMMADAGARAGAARGLGQLSVATLDALGQPLWRASNAAGFDDGSGYWGGPGQLAHRIAFARRMIARGGKSLDPRDFLQATLDEVARADTIAVVNQAPNREAGLLATLVSPEFNRR
jgi:uncharacterized protein (DUF1800 family)